MTSEELENLKQQSLEAILSFDVGGASGLIKELEFQIQKLSELEDGEEQFIEYSGLLTRLKMLRFAVLSDEEAIRLISENTIQMVNDPDLVLEERIEARQLAVIDFMRYETVNQPIMEALHKNTELIGDEKILVTGAENPELPYIKNWLLDYDRTHGTQPQKDLTWLDYAKKNVISAHLNPAQADTLRKVLRLYEWLKREHEID